jgi:biopolymer transport protein ExbD
MGVRLDHGEPDLGEAHEINVTRFIDVMRVSYGGLIQVMNLLRAADYLKVSLETLETDQPH